MTIEEISSKIQTVQKLLDELEKHGVFYVDRNRASMYFDRFLETFKDYEEEQIEDLVRLKAKGSEADIYCFLEAEFYRGEIAKCVLEKFSNTLAF